MIVLALVAITLLIFYIAVKPQEGKANAERKNH